MKTKMLLAVALCATAPWAAASCGSAFCMINTNWALHGPVSEPGLRMDLRYEYIDQDQPMAGGHKVGVGEIHRHHDEAYTTNRNWLASFDYTFNDAWGVSASVPVVDRQHFHIHNHHGHQIEDDWDFRRLGDIRVVGRRQWMAEPAEGPSFFGLTFGAKLPTGRYDIANADGDLAERSMQPGSGTTDLLLGAYHSRVLPELGLSWFAQVQVQRALAEREDYRPGSRVTADLGVRYEVTDKLGAMLQLNAALVGRDRGDEGEPEDSGGRSLSLSPGLSYAVAKGVQLYGFVQLPVYQKVNGVQLTAEKALVAGVSVGF
jgi:outer membrane receptor protein involved in Fe transport